MGLATGLFAAEELCWRMATAAPQLLGALAALTAALCVAALAVRKHVAAAVCIAGAVAGTLVGGLCWDAVGVATARVASTRSSAWTVECTSDASEGAFGASSLARVIEPPLSAVVRVQWPKGAAPPAMGARVTFYGSPAPVAAGPQALDAFRAGVAATLRARRLVSAEDAPGPLGVLTAARRWALAQTRAVPGDGGALLESTLLGARARLAASSAEQDLRVAGLAHFEATSGFHVMLVAAMAQTWLLSLGARRRTRFAVVAALLGSFVVLSGARISALRSAAMALLAPAGASAGRRADPLASLACVSAAFLCASPSLLFDIGFQFSVCGVGGILLFGRLAEGWVRAGLGGRLGRVAGPVAVTLCAVVATLPMAAGAFGFVSLVAPLSNLCAVPLVVGSFCAGLAGLALSVVSAPLGHAVLSGAGAVAAMLCSLATFFAHVPGAALAAGSALPLTVAVWLGAAIALWVCWPQPRAWVSRFAMGLAVVWLAWSSAPVAAPSGPIVRVMDVGQGDSILVEDGSHALLVDTGPDGASELQALGRAGVRHVDGVVITHLHADH